MKAVDFKSIALFFFFALLDEKKAISATAKAIKVFRGRQAKKPEIPVNIHLIQSALAVWEKFQPEFYRGRQNLTFSGDWILPKGIDLNPWKEFQKNAPEEELVALIWSKILLVPEKDIARALGLSEGTVRYRVGSGLTLLGTAGIFPSERSAKNSSIGLVKQ